MAESTNMVQQIDDAVSLLSRTLNAKFVNFFDRMSLEDIDLPRGSIRYLVATGTHACGEWRYGDDVRLVCLTETSESLFWEYVAECLQLKERTKMPASGVSIMELSSPTFSRALDGGASQLSQFATLSSKNKAGSKFYLHYCTLPSGFDPKDLASKVMPAYQTDPSNTHPNYQTASVQRNLNMIRDMQHLARDTIFKSRQSTSSHIHNFGEAYRNLRCWAKANGLFGPKLGFLDSESLMWVVHGAYMEHWSPKGSNLVDQEGGSLIKAVFDHFGYWLELLTSTQEISEEDLRAINLNIYTPTKFLISSHLTPEAKTAIFAAMKHTKDVEGVDTVTGTKPLGRFREFLDNFDYFLKLDCECWESSPAKRAKFEEHVIIDNINAIAKYFREKHGEPELGGLCIRVWPVPLEESVQESRLSYAIGLRRSPRSQYDAEPMKKYAGRIVDHIMENVLQYDSASGLITISLASSGDFEPLLQKVIADDGTTHPIETHSITPPTRDTNTSKFRTAAQAINRLRHDLAYAAIEYDLGYEDRFAGLVWIGLEEWGGKETEDEEFIPEHRVRRLRRRGDGVVVWDRERRVDLTGRQRLQ